VVDPLHLKTLALALACACTLIPSALADPGVVPPPTAASAEEGPEGVTLTWNAPVAADGVVGYVVYREDQAIATVTDTSYVDADGNSTNVYEVRAVDAEGRHSAPVPAAMLTNHCFTLKHEFSFVVLTPEDCLPGGIQTASNAAQTLHNPPIFDAQ
jgi:hypothetical protein